jgi:hypothetical protein
MKGIDFYGNKVKLLPGTAGPRFRNWWGNHIVDSIELETIRVFNTPITPIAELEHHYQLDLEFKLPGKQNYVLRYHNSGLRWEVL